LVSMPNGILAGFVNNEIWFCEPYLPHAWPANYMLTTEFPIVGLGVFGTTLVVCTTKNPYLVSGTTPSTMSQEKLPIVQPCVSKTSIASDQYGVVYACPIGLVAIGNGIMDVITTPLYTRDEWATVNPTSLIGATYNNLYFGFYNDLLSDNAGCLVLARNDTPQLVQLTASIRNVFVQRTTGNMYYINNADGLVYQINADPVNNTIFWWKSKVFDVPQPCTFGAMKVYANYTYMNSANAYNTYIQQFITSNQTLFASGAPLGGALAQSALNTYAIDSSALVNIPSLAATRYINVTVYGDGNYIWSGNFTSIAAVRMPAGVKCTEWEITITGNTPVEAITMASTMRELNTPLGDKAPWMPLAITA